MVSEFWKKDMIERPKLSVYIQSMRLATASVPCGLQECVNAIKGRNRLMDADTKIYGFARSVLLMM